MRDYEIHVVNKRDVMHSAGEYVGRPSVLGNPFTIGRHGTRDEVIVQYRAWLWDNLKYGTPQQQEIDRLAEKFITDGGLTLVCWCAPLKCHASIIADAIEWRNRP